jgi:hypothetical protein
MHAVVGTHPLVREVVLASGDHRPNSRKGCDIVEEILERTSKVILWLAYTRGKTRSQRSTERANGFAKATCGHGSSLGQRALETRDIGLQVCQQGFVAFCLGSSLCLRWREQAV